MKCEVLFTGACLANGRFAKARESLSIFGARSSWVVTGFRVIGVGQGEQGLPAFALPF